jgi:hypothetical protein
MTVARYLLIACATFCALLALAVLNAWAQIDTPTKHSYYTCSYILAKIVAGSAIASPKLVVISGSNALTGISMQPLTAELGIRGYNFGLAASFGPGFQSFEASKILKPGDAALLPLEYLAYDYATPRDSLIDAVYSCGFDYWRTLDWQQKIFFVMAAKPFRYLDSLLFRSHRSEMNAIAQQAAQDVGQFGQRPSSGAQMQVATAEPEVANHVPLSIHFDPDSAGARAIAQFVGWAKAHHVTVFATWPNTLYYPQYDHEAVFGQIRDFYRKMGVEVIGTPRDAMFPASLMGDSIYHPNQQGKLIRTAKLVETLRRDGAFVSWMRSNAGPASAR